MIDSRQRALWERLESFVIGTGDEPVGFTQRLARENAWPRDRSARVVREYLRFVFPCAEAGHPCTPSDAVDQAWHLHLVYTRSYWEEMTPLLPRPLHHGPGKGGAAEDAKHHDWYARTLASYRRMFGEEPPGDIWPATFAPEPETVRVSRRDFWLLPRRPLQPFGLAALALSIGGCALGGAEISILFLFLAFITVVIVTSVEADRKRCRRRRRNDSSGDSGCSGMVLMDTGGGHICDGHNDGHHAGDGGGDGGSDGGSGGDGGSGCGGGCGGGGD